MSIRQTPDLFSIEEARQKRDDALKAVEANAAKCFKDALRFCALDLAQNKGSFTADDVWALMQDKFPDVLAYRKEEPRALGAVMVKLAKSAHIVHSGQYVKSIRRHCTPIPVWRAA